MTPSPTRAAPTARRLGPTSPRARSAWSRLPRRHPDHPGRRACSRPRTGTGGRSPGKAGPLSDTLGVYDNIVAFKAAGTSHQAAIKQFLDFVYQDKYQLQFDNEYDLLPATQSAATDDGEGPDVLRVPRNITNSVNYPSLANWTSVENMIKTQVGQAITGNPRRSWARSSRRPAAAAEPGRSTTRRPGYRPGPPPCRPTPPLGDPDVGHHRGRAWTSGRSTEAGPVRRAAGPPHGPAVEAAPAGRPGAAAVDRARDRPDRGRRAVAGRDDGPDVVPAHHPAAASRSAPPG